MAEHLNEEKKFIEHWVDINNVDFYSIADAIWSYSELGMEEYKSSQALAYILKKYGFSIKKGAAGMPTAFVATYGTGKPTIVFSAEYDALPGLSQASVPEQKPIVQGAPGHGCGHNLLGVGAALAAVALKNAVEKFNLMCTIKVMGTPAEEICIGKPFMARAGLFNDIDVVFDWHPSTHNVTDYTTSNAYFNNQYHFKGKTAHGSAPWSGRSALDAALIMGNMIEHLREHMTPGSPPYASNTINYSFPDVGPSFPNVVPDRATIWVIGRFVTSEEANYIISRIDKCAQGAALATETTFEIERITSTHERIPNKTMAELVNRNLQSIGAPKFTQEEQDFAKRLQKAYNAPETGLDTKVTVLHGGTGPVSDNSEYSWFAPMSMLNIAIAPPGITAHSWGFAASAGSSIGKKALDVVGKVNACAALEIITRPEIIDEAKKEMREYLGEKKYLDLIPKTTKPKLTINQDIMDRYRPLQEKLYKDYQFIC
jgi:aminobenzoyl-glutamate utilization protein B